jgi:hypothetical protein
MSEKPIFASFATKIKYARDSIWLGNYRKISEKNIALRFVKDGGQAQVRARSKAVSSDLKRLLVLNSMLLPNT